MDLPDRDQPFFLSITGAPMCDIDPMVDALVQGFSQFAAYKGEQATLIPFAATALQCSFVVAFPDQPTLERLQHIPRQFLVALSDARYALLGVSGVNTLLMQPVTAMSDFIQRTGASTIDLKLSGGISFSLTESEARRF